MLDDPGQEVSAYDAGVHPLLTIGVSFAIEVDREIGHLVR
jgi:hypothetical protein